MSKSTEHTPGAIRAAEVITRGRYDEDRMTYDTRFGRKTVRGIAAIIDELTAVPDLLAACEAMHKYLTVKADIVPFPAEEASKIAKAIDKAKAT